MEDISDLTILIGPNGSGKSNILEALHLFFGDFQAVGGKSSPVLQDVSCWHRKLMIDPIEIELSLELDVGEPVQILGEELLKNIVDEKIDVSTIEVSRMVPSPGVDWNTRHLRLGKIALVENFAPVDSETLAESLHLPKAGASGDIKAYFFQPEKEKPDFRKPKILALSKIAFKADTLVKELVEEGRVPYEIVSDVELSDWVDQQGLSLEGRPPTAEELKPFFPEEPRNKEVQKHILGGITRVLKNRFKLMLANRDVRGTPGERTSFLETSLVEEMREFGMSRDTTFEGRQSEYKEGLYKFLQQEIDFSIGEETKELFFWDRKVRLPHRVLGGGQQEIIGLIYEIKNTPENDVLAVEEPENHLHTSYEKLIFGFLQDESKNRQVLITTHSFTTADKGKLINNWWIEREYEETSVRRIETKEQLRKALGLLGGEPSDYMFPNNILLACETERTFLSTLARERNIKIDGVLTPLEGDYDPRKIEIVSEHFKNTPVSLILVLDKHGEKTANDAVKEGHIERRNCFILDKGSLEDYYPKDILAEVLKELTGNPVNQNMLSSPTDKSIQKNVKKLPRKWKQILAEEIPKRLDKVDTIFLDILSRLQSSE